MEELKALMVLRGLTKLYKQFSEEPEIFKLMRDLNIEGPSNETVFYYFSSPPPNKKKLPRTKVKIDLLKFREKPWTIEISVDRLHLNEIGDFINGLIQNENNENGGKLGICSRTIFHRIKNDKKGCDWNKMFANPLICQDKTANPDLKYWRISKLDRKYLCEEENNYEENKQEENRSSKVKSSNVWANKTIEKSNVIINEIRKKPEKPQLLTDLDFVKALLDKYKEKYLNLHEEIQEIKELDGWLEITLDKLEKQNKIQGKPKSGHQLSLIIKFKNMEKSEKKFMKIVKVAQEIISDEEIMRLNDIMHGLKIFDV